MLIVEEHFRNGILVYIWAKYFWVQVLQARQRNVLGVYQKVPSELKDVWTEENYEQHRVLALYKSGFQFFKDTISTAITTSLVVFNGFRTLWEKSGEILLCFGYDESYVILHNVVFITILNSLKFFVNLPFSAYEVYITEGRLGLHRVTMSGAILGHVVSQMVIFPFVCLFVAVFKLGGSRVFLYMFYIAELQVVLEMCNMDNIEILPASELRNKIQEFIDDQNLSIYDIYLVKNPKLKSHHSQAYVSGSSGQKIIVIYDNVARKHLEINSDNQSLSDGKDLSIDEIVALVAHEVGHWKGGHDFIYFFVNQIYLCVHLYSLHVLMNYQPMYRAFGFNDIQPYAVGFVLIQSYPLTELCSSWVRVINRQLEFAADRYAKSLKKDKSLNSAMAKIAENTSEFPVQDWLYSFCNNNRPSCYERIIALNYTHKTINHPPSG